VLLHRDSTRTATTSRAGLHGFRGQGAARGAPGREKFNFAKPRSVRHLLQALRFSGQLSCRARPCGVIRPSGMWFGVGFLSPDDIRGGAAFCRISRAEHTRPGRSVFTIDCICSRDVLAIPRVHCGTTTGGSAAAIGPNAVGLRSSGFNAASFYLGSSPQRFRRRGLVADGNYYFRLGAKRDASGEIGLAGHAPPTAPGGRIAKGQKPRLPFEAGTRPPRRITRVCSRWRRHGGGRTRLTPARTSPSWTVG